jgi:hypothetical protein
MGLNLSTGDCIRRKEWKHMQSLQVGRAIRPCEDTDMYKPGGGPSPGTALAST